MSTAAAPESDRLIAENEELRQEVRLLELKVQKLQRELWGRKSERYAPGADEQGRLFEDQAERALAAPDASHSAASRAMPGPSSGKPRGPKPLDPALPREVIAVPAPELKDLICPATQRPMQPGFVETLEVLARRPAVYYVKRYERTVFVSPAKTAPVYTPWPADVLPRSRVHASIVAHVAAAHYCEHVPFHRLEQQLARAGVDLPRVTQVSLMEQLNQRLAPLVVAMKLDVLQSDYVMLDATPVPVCDPQRPGAAREATLWAYRNAAGTVWFDYQASKSPQHPDRVLKAAGFCGLLQTDGASGLGEIGTPGKVVSLGCLAHARRHAFEAWQAGERNATPYLETINRLFRLDRLARHFGLTVENKAELRRRHSLPRFEAMMAQARVESLTVAPRTGVGKALHYLLGQETRLRETLRQPRAELSTNRVENTIRPLKLGARNWLQIGHPEAGPRLANLFTVVENCRQLELDPEAYLVDLIARLPDHPAARVAELLPRAWQKNRAAATTVAAAPD